MLAIISIFIAQFVLIQNFVSKNLSLLRTITHSVESVESSDRNATPNRQKFQFNFLCMWCIHKDSAAVGCGSGAPDPECQIQSTEKIVILIIWHDFCRTTFIQRNNETMAKTYEAFWCAGPRPHDAGTPLLLLLLVLYPTIQCNCSTCDVPPDAGLQNRPFFLTNCRCGRRSNTGHLYGTCTAALTAQPSLITLFVMIRTRPV
jgi:hypothetical protein